MALSLLNLTRKTYNIDYVKNNYQRNCLETAKGEKVTVPKIDYYDRTQLRGMPFPLVPSLNHG